MKTDTISMSVVRRLPRYYRFLYDLKENGIERISSRELAQRMGLTASQIRQDLNCFGGFGQQGYGYSVASLYETIGHILGIDDLTPAVLLGAGNLGRAIASTLRFETRGFRLAGIVDDNPRLVGMTLAGITVRPLSELEDLCRQQHVRAAFLCIPKEAAPALVERLLALNVRAFWNFSHFDIALRYQNVIVENVHMGDSLMTLSYEMRSRDEETERS